MKFLIALAGILLCLTSNAGAQSKSEATASVNVISADRVITGNINSSSFELMADAVNLSTTHSAENSNNHSALNKTNKVADVASFSISGSANTFDVSVPSESIAVGRNSKDVLMNISSFSVVPFAGTSLNHSTTITVQAKVTADAFPPPGLYTSKTPITVTVNFN